MARNEEQSDPSHTWEQIFLFCYHGLLNFPPTSRATELEVTTNNLSELEKLVVCSL